MRGFLASFFLGGGGRGDLTRSFVRSFRSGRRRGVLKGNGGSDLLGGSQLGSGGLLPLLVLFRLALEPCHHPLHLLLVRLLLLGLDLLLRDEELLPGRHLLLHLVLLRAQLPPPRRLPRHQVVLRVRGRREDLDRHGLLAAARGLLLAAGTLQDALLARPLLLVLQQLPDLVLLRRQRLRHALLRDLAARRARVVDVVHDAAPRLEREAGVAHLVHVVVRAVRPDLLDVLLRHLLRDVSGHLPQVLLGDLARARRVEGLEGGEDLAGSLSLVLLLVHHVLELLEVELAVLVRVRLRHQLLRVELDAQTVEHDRELLGRDLIARVRVKEVESLPDLRLAQRHCWLLKFSSVQ
eukprot:Rhum_TRINITY_DN14711_c8_g1::Rhum_TRINITY_DN14711_c8_g1_i1::g.111649::m.111649